MKERDCIYLERETKNQIQILAILDKISIAEYMESVIDKLYEQRIK